MIQRLTVEQFNQAYAHQISVQRQMIATMKGYAGLVRTSVEHGDEVHADYAIGQLRHVSEIFDHYARALCVCFEVETGIKLGKEAA